MDYLQQLGPLAIASRLKHLSDLFMRDMAGIYHARGIDFEPRWFTLLYLLYQQGPHPITRISRKLGQSHPAANQVANVLEKKGYIISRKDTGDQRKRILFLSPDGLTLINQMVLLWQAVEEATRLLLSEYTRDFLKEAAKLEAGLKKIPAKDRILNQYRANGAETLQIADFSPAYKKAFKRLNEGWLKQHFQMEAEDIRLLENPEKEILDRGGLILFALLEKDVVGTGALLHVNTRVCELTKMAVDPPYQGRQIGRNLLRNLLHRARFMGYEKMVLLTSDKLEKAVSLYRSEGFRPSAAGSLIEHNLLRCSVQLEINL